MLSSPRLFFYLNLIFISFIFIYNLKIDSLEKAQSSSQLVMYHGEQVSLIGRVCREAEVDYKSRRLTICTPEKVLVSTNLYPEYDYGDVLQVKGIITAPPSLDNFDYARYLGKSEIYSVMYHAQLFLLQTEQTNNLGEASYLKLLKFKRILKDIFNQSLVEPGAGLAKALFLGDRRQILAADKETFARTGLSHLIAISGTHIAILSVLLIKFTTFLRLARRPALLINLMFLTFYPLFTGLSASAIRASLMGFLVIIAFYEGRLITSVRALVFSATLMLIFNPRLLNNDIGFQLSYSAILGIIYIYPLFNPLKNYLKKLFTGLILKFLITVTEILSLTLACQIATLPILLINFQQLSRVSLVANVLVIWIFPFLFIFLIIPLLLAAIWPTLSPWFFAPAHFCLIYIFKVARYLASFPGAVIVVENFGSGEVILYYLGLSLIIYLLRRKARQKNKPKTSY